jgi:hypothetical protein
MDDSKSGLPKPEATRKLVLSLPKPHPVATSLGTLYVRRISMRDVEALGPSLKAGATPENDSTLGSAVLRRQTARAETPDALASLDTEDFNKLDDSDVMELAEAIAEVNALGAISTSDGIGTYQALGQAVREKLIELSRQMAATMETVRKSMESQLSFLGDSTRKALMGNVADISLLSKQLSLPSAIAAFKEPSVRDLAAKAMADPSIARIAESMKATSPGSAREQAKLGASVLGRNGTPSDGPDLISGIKVPDIAFSMPDPRTMPAYRAARAGEAAAEHLADVAETTSQMMQSIGTLTTTMMTEVWPKWQAKVEDDRKSGQVSLAQANSSLKWTKWAMIASVLVSIATTGWQLWIARENRLEADKQQAAQLAHTEALMREQTEAMKSLRVELSRQATELQRLGASKAEHSPVAARASAASASH